jgi:hypothetical protein
VSMSCQSRYVVDLDTDESACTAATAVEVMLECFKTFY